MSFRPEPLPPIPDATAAAVRAAFPKGNLYVDLRAEFGTLYDDQLFADLYPPEGRPVEVAPWRLALVVVMQYMEGLTDRQAADAVRRCMDWKYALSPNRVRILFTPVGSLADLTGPAELRRSERFPSQASEIGIMPLPAMVALRVGISRVSRVNSPPA
jgi:Transposase domain (DUF772)